MVQIKQQKGTPAKQGKGKQQEVKKPQLQFSSSDEEEDSDVELGEEAEDEELFDEELSDEELLDEEEGEDDEENEEEVEGIVPTKTQTAAKNTKVDNKKAPPPKEVKKTPSKAELAAEAKAAKQKATNGAVKEVEKKGAQKRKAEEPTTKTPAKQSRINDQSNILDEETRRREERNKRSLFFKGVGKLVKKMTEIKALHPDIVSVRTMGLNAWALFPTEASAVKAHEALKEKSVNGRKLTLDFCGSKAKNSTAEGGRNTDKPINKLALLVAGLPNGTTAEKLKLIFPNSKAIELPKTSKKNTTVAAFVHFATEQDAQNSFVKNESLKVGGTPVEVLFARQRN